MKKAAFIFFLFVFGLFIGCIKDEENTEPIPPDPEPKLDLILTIRVDGSGGREKAEDFELTIPGR